MYICTYIYIKKSVRGFGTYRSRQAFPAQINIPARNRHILPRINISCPGSAYPAQDQHVLPGISISCPDQHILTRINISCQGSAYPAQDQHILPKISTSQERHPCFGSPFLPLFWTPTGSKYFCYGSGQVLCTHGVLPPVSS
jgi:hypothetical protein